MVASFILKNLGEVSSNITEKKIVYRKSDGFGGEVEAKGKMIKHAELNLEVDFYNNAEAMKSINCIKLLLVDENNETIKELSLQDSLTYRVPSKITHFNIEPKKLLNQQFGYLFKEKELEAFMNAHRCIFSYAIIRNRADKIKTKTHVIDP